MGLHKADRVHTCCNAWTTNQRPTYESDFPGPASMGRSTMGPVELDRFDLGSYVQAHASVMHLPWQGHQSRSTTLEVAGLVMTPRHLRVTALSDVDWCLPRAMLSSRVSSISVQGPLDIFGPEVSAKSYCLSYFKQPRGASRFNTSNRECVLGL